MESVLTGTASKRPLAGIIEALEDLAKRHPDIMHQAYLEIICPNTYTQLWLSDILQTTTIQVSFPNKIFNIIPFEEWLNTRYPGLSPEAQITALEQTFVSGAENICQRIVYAPSNMPKPFQAYIQQLETKQLTTLPFVGLQVTSHSPEKMLVQINNPSEEGAYVFSLLHTLGNQRVPLSDVLLLCHSKGSLLHWQEQLSLAGIPIWGNPSPEDQRAFHLLELVLRCLQYAQKSSAASYTETLYKRAGLLHLKNLLRIAGPTIPPIEREPFTLLQYPQIKPLVDTLETLYALCRSDAFPGVFLRHILKFGLSAQQDDNLQRICLKILEQLQDSAAPRMNCEAFMAWLQAHQSTLLFTPDTTGLRILTIEQASGIQSPYLIVPQIEDYFNDVDKELQLFQLTNCVKASQSVFACYHTTQLAWDSEQIAEQWLADWPRTEAGEWPHFDLPVSRTVHASENTEWLTYNASSATLVIREEDSLVLSPSSLETYLSCPRKFFYQSTLELRDKTTTPQAALGTLIHKLLEVFNLNFQHDYTLECLQELTQQFFAEDAPWETLEKLGFVKKDLAELKQLPALQQHQMEHQILLAFADMQAKGYFDVPFSALIVEEALSLCLPEELPGLTLKGRADLIRQKIDGSLEIIDYKTSRQKYNFVKAETNLRPLINALEPVDWKEPSNYKRFAGREYQLPLYWLMAQSNPYYAESPIDVSIQLVRPPTALGKTGGSGALTLSHQALQHHRGTLLEMLQKGIAEPARSSDHFPALGNRQKHCSHCTYSFLCEGPQEEEDEEETFGG